VKTSPENHFELQPLEPRILLSGDAAELLSPAVAPIVEVLSDPAPEPSPEELFFEPMAEMAIPMSSDEFPTGDTFTNGGPINVGGSVFLVFDPNLTPPNTFGANTFLFDTTNKGAVPNGGDILIQGSIQGTGHGLGGILYLNAGTNGNITINGSIGNDADLERIVILNANNVTLNGNVILRSFHQIEGRGNTTIGQSGSNLFRISHGNAQIETLNDITFNSRVLLGEPLDDPGEPGNLILRTGIPPGATGLPTPPSAKITFNEEVEIRRGNLHILNAREVEALKDLDVSGQLLQSAGLDRSIFRGDVVAGTVDITTLSQIRFTGAVLLQTGDMTLTSNEVKFQGGARSVVGAESGGVLLSNLLIRPSARNVSMDIGTPISSTGLMKFTASDVAALENGFSSITFGYAPDASDPDNILVATGAVRAGSAAFFDPLTVYGGSITITGSFGSRTEMVLDAATGNILIDGGQVRVINEQVESVWGSSRIELNAQTGNIILRNNGLIEIDNNSNSDPSQGSDIFLTAALAILNEAGSTGEVTGRNLTALATGNINLRTEVDTLDARSTVSGQINIFENSAIRVLHAFTANGRQIFNAGGATTIDYARSDTDSVNNTLQVTVVNGGLDIGLLHFGGLGNVTLTVEGEVTGFSGQSTPHVVGNVLAITSEDHVGESLNPLLITANALRVKNEGRTVVRQLAGRSQLQVSVENGSEEAGDQISLQVLGGGTVVNGEGIQTQSTGGIRLETAGALTVNSHILGVGGLLTLLAGGDTLFATGIRAESGGGDGVLSVIGNLSMTPTSVLATGGGNLTVTVDGNMTAGVLDTRTSAGPQSGWGHAAVTVTGSLADTAGSNAVNVFANTLRLLTGNGIGALPLLGIENTVELDVAILAAVTQSGVIAVRDINNLTISSTTGFTPKHLLENGEAVDGDAIAPLAALIHEGGGDILVSAAGVLTVVSEDDAVATQGQGTVVLVAEAMNIRGTVRSEGGDISLSATGNIELNSDGNLLTTGGGDIAVSSSAGSFLSSAVSEVSTGDGTLMISAQNNLTLGKVKTDGQVGLRAVTGSVRAATGGNNTRIVVQGDSLALVAENGVNGPASTTEAFRIDVFVLSLQGGAGPQFRMVSEGSLTLDTASASATLFNSLREGSTLEILPFSDAVIDGSGNLSIVMDSGDGIVASGRTVSTGGTGTILLDAAGALRLESESLVQSGAGNITLLAGGNIKISRVVSTSGNIFAESESGFIFDADPSASLADFETAGQLTLLAEEGIGLSPSEHTPFTVLLGTLRAESTRGGIFVTSPNGFTTNGLITLEDDAPIALTSGGNLQVNGNAGQIAASSAGTFLLSADGSLTQALGTQITAASDVFLISGGAMTLARVATPENLMIEADSVMGHPATSGVEIAAEGLLFDAVGTFGSPVQPMRLEVGRMAGQVTSGTLAFTNTGDLTLAPVAVEVVDPDGGTPGRTADPLAVTGEGAGVLAFVDGTLTVEAPVSGSAFSVAGAIPVRWETAGNQVWLGTFDLGGGPATLRSHENLHLFAVGTSSTGDGSLYLHAADTVWTGADAVVLTGSGSYLIIAGNIAQLDGALLGESEGAVRAGVDILADAAGAAVRLGADSLVLFAGRTIGGAVAVSTETRLGSFHAAEGGIRIENSGDLTLTNLGFTLEDVQLNADVFLAFSGLQGGVLAQNAGAIDVNTTGDLVVHEVAATTAILPDSLQSLVVRVSETGPDGNDFSILLQVIRDDANPIDASEAQNGSDLRTGDPVSTVYFPSTRLLQVFIRNGVSTLAEIANAIAASDLPASVMLTGGPADGSQVFELGINEDVLFVTSGGRREGVLSDHAGVFAGGAEPVAATAQINFADRLYSVRLTSLEPGADANDVVVRLLDDGPGGRLTDFANQAEVEWISEDGLLNVWINFGSTTLGTLMAALDAARDQDSVPFTAEIIGVLQSGDLNNPIGAGSVMLQSNLSATAVLRPVGNNNDFQVSATIGGDLYNGVQFVFLDDGSQTSGGASASFNGQTNLMTIRIESGITTANAVIAALNSEGSFTASLVPELNGGVNTGNGPIQAHRFRTSGGAVLVQSSALLRMVGTNNDVILTADLFGADQNGIEIRLIEDPMLGVGDVEAQYNSFTRILTLRISAGFASANALINAVNNGPNAAAIPLTASLAPGSQGFGALILANYPLTAGGTGGPARAVFTAPGGNNDFEAVAEADTNDLENIRVFVIDDGTILDGSADGTYLPGPRHLIVNVQSGVTTVNTLRSFVNAPGNGIPVIINLLPGNDGTGVLNPAARAFADGLDPVAPTLTLDLPSGNTLVLETLEGGVAFDGIQVVILADSSLSPETAAAEYYEGDGVRRLTFRLADANVTLQSLQDALDVSELPFRVLNLTGNESDTLGTLSEDASVSLSAEGDMLLTGRVLAWAGAAELSTGDAGDLRFESTTARVRAWDSMEIDLDGSLVNTASTEMPLLFVYRDGLLRISTQSVDSVSDLPIDLLSRGDIEITGAGLVLDNQAFTANADGSIVIDAPISTGAAPILLNAGETITVTPQGSLTGEGVELTARLDVILNGHLSATGTSNLLVTSEEGSILMGGASTALTESGNALFTASLDIGVTFIGSTNGGNLILEAGGRIFDAHATDGLNLSTTGQTWLTAQTGIGAIGTGDLKTEVAIIRLRNLGEEGDVVITQTNGDLDVIEITQNADATDEGWVILNVEDGDLTLSGPSTLAGDGSFRATASGDLTVDAPVTLEGEGSLALEAGGDLEQNADILLDSGDAVLFSGGSVIMQALTELLTEEGNVLVDATGAVIVARIVAGLGAVRLNSTEESILRASSGTSENIIAQTLQLRAGESVGSLADIDEALVTEVSRLTAFAGNGDLALFNSGNLTLGESELQFMVAQDGKTFLNPSFTETQLTASSGNAVLRVAGALELESIGGPDATVEVNGNFRLDITGSVEIQGDVSVSNGAAHLSVGGNLDLNGDLDVSGGSLLFDVVGDLTQDGAAEIRVANQHTIIKAGGLLTLARLEAGSGDVALTAGESIRIAADAPPVNVLADALRLNAGGDIGTVAAPLVVDVSALTSSQPGTLHLRAESDTTVISVTVSANTVSLLGVISEDTLHVATAQSDLVSTDGGDLLVDVDGRLSLRDGDGNGRAARTFGSGGMFLQATNLDVYATLVSADGLITLSTPGALHFLNDTDSIGGIDSNTGDISLTAGEELFMVDGARVLTLQGNIRLDAGDDITLGGISAAQGLVSVLTSGQVLDGGDTHIDIIADRLHLIASEGFGELGLDDNPINTRVNQLAATITSGPFAMLETGSIQLTTVQGEVDALNQDGSSSTVPVGALFGLRSLGGGDVSLIAAGSVTVASDATTDPGVSVTEAGNLLIQAGTLLTVNDDVLAAAGHITLRANTDLTTGNGVLIQTGGTGTITLLATTGTLLQGAQGTVQTATGDLHVQAAGSVTVSGLRSAATVSVRSVNGPVLNGDTGQINVISNALRLQAGQHVALGATPLTVDVNTVTALALNGGIFLRGESTMAIAPVGALTQTVNANGTVTPNPIAVQSAMTSGGTAGTIVVRVMNGDLTATPLNAVTAAGQGNILLEAENALTLLAPVSSGSGTITLLAVNGDFTLANSLQVTTSGLGQIQAIAGGAFTSGPNSRFVAGSGNVVLGAEGNLLLGGIQTTGFAAVGSATGVILGSGSTDFAHEVVAARLLLAAPLGGVGTLAPNLPAIPLRTSVSRLAGVGGLAGLHVVNSIAMSVGTVTVDSRVVTATGALLTVPDQILSGVETLLGDSPIVLRTLSGTLTLNQAVSAKGAGNILLRAATGLILNAAATSEQGHITLRAGTGVTLNEGVSVTTGAPGTIYVLASAGAITMAADAVLTAPNSAIAMSATGNIVLGSVISGAVSIRSSEGTVTAATGSVLNVTAQSLRLDAAGSIGTPSSPLLIDTALVSARSQTGSIFLQASGPVTVGSLGPAGVQSVQLDATTLPVEETNLSGLRTFTNGNIVLVNLSGNLTVNEAVNAHGTGRILLQGNSALALNANVASGSGAISLLAGNGISAAEGVVISTGSTGSVDMDAGTGTIVLPAVGGISAPGGPVRLFATGDIFIGSITAAQAAVTSTVGGIFRAATGVNITASALRLNAGSRIGLNEARLRISASSLSARAATGIHLVSPVGTTVTSVSLSTPRVLANATLSSVTDSAQADLRTTDNGDIFLRAETGSITLNDGNGDGSAVVAHGAGSVRIDAGNNLNINSAVRSGTGVVTLHSQNNFTLAATTIETGGSGDLSLMAVNGAMTMTGTAQVRALGGSIRAAAQGSITLANLNALSVSVVSNNGAVINAANTSRNITAAEALIVARNNVGALSRRISLNVGILAARSTHGGLYFSELNDLMLGTVSVTVMEYDVNGNLSPRTDGPISGLDTLGQGDIVLVANGNLILDAVNGATVNFVSGGTIQQALDPVGVIRAGALLLRAEDDIGSLLNPMRVETDLISAHSLNGSVYLFEGSSTTVGAVPDLTDPSDPNRTQNGIQADGDVYVASAGDLVLGLVTGETVVLATEGRVLSSPGATPNVEAGELVLLANLGVGETGEPLRIRVDTVAAVANGGDVILSALPGLNIGTVTLPESGSLFPESVSGIQILDEGDLSISVTGPLNVLAPIVVSGNVRLSSTGVLQPGVIVAERVSLLSGSAIVHPEGLISAEALRVNAVGNVTLLTDVEQLSVISQLGTVTVTEATSAALASVEVTAAGVTDAAQHGVEAPGAITLTTLSGRWLDGGDADDDIRSVTGPLLLTGADGIGTPGAGALDISVPELTVVTTQGGSVYLNLTGSSDIQGITLNGLGHLYLMVDGDLTQSGPVSVPQGSAFVTVSGEFTGSALFDVSRDFRLTAQAGALLAGSLIQAATGDMQLRLTDSLVMAAGAHVHAVAGTLRIVTGADLIAGLLEAGRVLDLRTGGNLSAASADRLTHELRSGSLRLVVQGTVQPVLTNTQRLDVRAGGVVEIFEYDSLTAGRFGFELINPASKDEFVLRMGTGTLDSLNENITVREDVVFVLTSASGSTVTLATPVVLPNGDIRIVVDGMALHPDLSGVMLSAAVGDVILNAAGGIGTQAQRINIDAVTFTALAQSGQLFAQFVTPVTVGASGVQILSGSGPIDLTVWEGNISLDGVIRQHGTGTVQITTPNGGISVPVDGSTENIRTGGRISLNLDTGITVAGNNRINLHAATLSAVTQTGNLRMNLMLATQIAQEGIHVLSGGGLINLRVATGNLTMAANAMIRTMGTGNLTVNVVNGAFTMAASNEVRSGGAMDIRVRNTFTIGVLRSLGTSTRIESTHANIARADGTEGNLFLASPGSHTPQIFHATGISLWVAANVARVNGQNFFIAPPNLYIFFPPV
jgi:hypothetical protein